MAGCARAGERAVSHRTPATPSAAGSSGAWAGTGRGPSTARAARWGGAHTFWPAVWIAGPTGALLGRRPGLRVSFPPARWTRQPRSARHVRVGSRSFWRSCSARAAASGSADGGRRIIRAPAVPYSPHVPSFLRPISHFETFRAWIQVGPSLLIQSEVIECGRGRSEWCAAGAPRTTLPRRSTESRKARRLESKARRLEGSEGFRQPTRPPPHADRRRPRGTPVAAEKPR